MKKRTNVGTLVLLIVMILALALPTLAKMPDRADMSPSALPDAPDSASDISSEPEISADVQVSDAGLEWVSSSDNPGFYAVRDWRNLDAATHGLVGGHQSFYWDQLNPFEGYYDWSAIESFLTQEIAAGKTAAIGIITFNSRLNEGNAADPPIRVPDYVFSAGADKITCGDGFQIPKYWDPVYMAKYTTFINALAAKYDGDPRVEFIQIGVGKFGETQPCDDDDDAWVEAALQADGYTMYSWPYMVMDITEAYDNAFSQTMLYLPNAPTFKSDKSGFKLWTEDAISRGIGVFPAGLMPIQEAVDYRPKSGWGGYGKFDQILTHIENFEAGTEAESWVPISQEAYNYMTPTAVDYYWAVLGALRRRVDHITLEHNLLYDGDTPRSDFSDFVWVMEWATQYMGKSISEAPSAWVAMREAGYKDNWYPQKGNYTYWLYQDDTVPNGQTVVTTWRSARDLVHGTNYDYYGEAATVRAEIENGQTFLGGPTGTAKEGWICRRTDQGSGNRYIAMDLDDRFAYGGPRSATISVTYFDRGTDSWQLVYDAVGNANQVAGTVYKQNTNTWKTQVFSVADAAFTNLQSGGTDLRIDCMNDGDEYIHMVDVDTDGGGVTPTPSATTDPNITPSATPSSTITPTPSITPRVTPTPVIVDLPANVDTYISSYYPDTNYGTDHRLVARSGVANSLIGFDTSSIPTNATISSARLYTYLDWYEHQMHLEPNVSVHKVKQSWLEGEATWNDRMTDSPWSSGGASGAADRESSASATTTVSTISTWYSWDVTDLVQDWAYSPSGNQGLILVSDSGRELRFHSSEYSSNQPYLHVEYSASGTAPTATPTATMDPAVTPTVSPGTVSEFRGASQDTYIDSSSPTDNKENEWLHVQGPGWRRTLIDFAISGEVPAGSHVVSSTLKLVSSYPGDGRTQGLNVDVFKVNRPWTASQATYNEAQSGTSWATAGCDGVPSDRDGTPVDTQWVQDVSTGSLPNQRITYSWDVTLIIQDWVDDYASQYGLMLFASDDGSAYRDLQFYDSSYMPQGSDELVPALLVEWTTGSTTPTPTLTPDASKGNVEGTVYNDENMDGDRQVGEMGVLGATVNLKSGQSVVGSYTTTGSGEYNFSNVEVGAYSVEVAPPSGYQVSTQNPYPVVVTGGSTAQADFGVYSAANTLFLPIIRK